MLKIWQRFYMKKKWIFKQSAAPTLATLAGAANGRFGRWRRVGLLGSADFVLIFADVVLKTTTILKEMRFAQLSS